MYTTVTFMGIDFLAVEFFISITRADRDFIFIYYLFDFETLRRGATVT